MLVPNDVRRLFLFGLTPKAFLALSVIRKNLSRICLEPRYMRVKQEWSRHVVHTGGGFYYMTVDQVLPNGTIDGVRYVLNKGLRVKGKSQWRNGERHGVSDEYYSDSPAYNFYLNGQQEGIQRGWSWDDNKECYFVECEELRVNGIWIWYREYDSNGKVIDSQG